MGWLFWWRPPCLLRRVVVNFTHTREEAIEGVLWSMRGPWLTFRDCAPLVVQHDAKPMPGEIVVHRSTIAFLQVLP